MEPELILDGLYTQRNRIDWAFKMTLEGSTCLIEEQNGSKVPNLDDDGDDYY
jgi:hypothetical protein